MADCNRLRPRPVQTYTGKQGFSCFEGIAREAAGSQAICIPADTPHLPCGPRPARAVIARTGPHEQESVVLQPELEALVPPGTA